ncbi:hypothetical protein SAY87_029903 [Trapa incisa]|uniref:Uncharacterized protein n=1 Tax=Trapa incisa TaxID=236973 RepID=A0AAN7Q9Y4_9MYRT|nr:hypothetical protein SAY87_029903 [Trapa incisa]
MMMGDLKKQAEQSRKSPVTITTTTTTSLAANNPLSWPCQAISSPGNFGLERVVKEDLAGHGREPHTGCSMEEHEVELTLSIGGDGNTSNRKPNKIKVEKKLVASLSIEADGSDTVQEGGVSGRERKHPHWLFQV